jgi:hypothetical protein
LTLCRVWSSYCPVSIITGKFWPGLFSTLFIFLLFYFLHSCFSCFSIIMGLACQTIRSQIATHTVLLLVLCGRLLPLIIGADMVIDRRCKICTRGFGLAYNATSFHRCLWPSTETESSLSNTVTLSPCSLTQSHRSNTASALQSSAEFASTSRAASLNSLNYSPADGAMHYASCFEDQRSFPETARREGDSSVPMQ